MPFRTHSCFQYAGEIADIFVRAVRAEWEGALLSDLTDEVQSTDDVLAAIRAAVPDARVSGSDNRRISPPDGFDTGPLRQIIGDWPRVPLNEGVSRTIELFRQIEKRGG